MFKTADLSDQYSDRIAILPQKFNLYGKNKSFCGKIRTVSCYEDNSFVKSILDENGKDMVLVIDGKASMNCALLGDMLADKAQKNEWSGIIVNGCIRDSEIISNIPLGVCALSTHPLKSVKKNVGEKDVEINLFDNIFTPGDFIYVDSDGILLSKFDLLAK